MTGAVSKLKMLGTAPLVCAWVGNVQWQRGRWRREFAGVNDPSRTVMTAQPPANPCTSSFVRPSRASSVTHGIGWVRHSCRGVLPCGIVLLSRGTRHTAQTATASRAMPGVAGVPLCRSRSDGLRPHSLTARRGARGLISSGRIMMSSFSSLTSLRCASDARPRPPCHAGCQRPRGGMSFMPCPAVIR